MNTPTLIFTDKTVLVRHSSIFATQVDQDVIMLDEAAGLYFALNSVAASIWELLEKPISYKQLLESLMETYDVQYPQCKADVDSLLEKLHQYQLVRVVDQI